MSRLSEFIASVRTGFSRNFWVANTLELFERFAYYGARAILTVFVAEQVGLGPVRSTFLVGSVFNTLLYFLPVLAGTVVDRYGFKKSLLACFSIFSVGYLLIGLGGLPAGKPLVDALGPQTYMIIALLITAVGGSLIKPSIVGTVARTTTPDTRALGYSIYYTLVNVGGALGPNLMLLVRKSVGISYVLVTSALVSLLLALATLFFFTEPVRPADAPPPRSMARVFKDMLLVFSNWRFMSFLVIFSGFWAMFWPVFDALPFYARDVLGVSNFEFVETVDAWTIIVVTVPAAALARKLPALGAMTIGFILSTCCWLILGTFPTLPLTVAGLMLFAIGEATQAPRYYEYVSDLAPKAQVGTYMGFAFLPIAIGSYISGGISGRLVQYYIHGPGRAAPQRMWYVVGAIGAVTTVLMVLYDRLLVRPRVAPPAPSSGAGGTG
jgi:POT family proton-dependent oligopeptide transporter